MRITGNRARTIESYEYIFKQFVEVCRIEYVEDINLDKRYVAPFIISRIKCCLT